VGGGPARAGRLVLLARTPGAGLGLVGGVVLLLLAAVAVVPGVVAQRDPHAIDADRRLQPPSAAHPFGTDELGRDLWSRVVHGTRLSLGAAVVVVGVSGTVGTVLGLLAGFSGGRSGELVMRVADVFIAFPALIMAMGITAFLGPGLVNSMTAVMVIW
jgi:ABC-type dipeptide/oligopeptide/nickel transport system permease subunit